MGEVVYLRLKERELSLQDLVNPSPKMITIKKQQYEHDMLMKDRIDEHCYCLEEELRKIKNISWWKRTCKWPY
jgi:hypothetical protein